MLDKRKILNRVRNSQIHTSNMELVDNINTPEEQLSSNIWSSIVHEYEEEPYPTEDIEGLSQEELEFARNYVKDINAKKKKEGVRDGLRTLCLVKNYNEEYDTESFCNALKSVTQNGTYGEMDMEIKKMSIDDLLSYNMHKWGNRIPNPTHKNGGLIVIDDFSKLIKSDLPLDNILLVITQIMRFPAGGISSGWGVVIFCSNEDEFSFLWDNYDFIDCVKIF